jgi:hypothetical protein
MVVVVVVVAWLVLECSRGGKGSSALMPKAKHSNEKARLRPPPPEDASNGTIAFEESSQSISNPTATGTTKERAIWMDW